jgi:hypothetical protein
MAAPRRGVPQRRMRSAEDAIAEDAIKERDMGNPPGFPCS